MREHPKNPLRFLGTPLAPYEVAEYLRASVNHLSRELGIQTPPYWCGSARVLNQLSSSRDQ
jgi:hypothetical protein